MTESTSPVPSMPGDVTIAICTIGRDGYLQAAIQSLLDTSPDGVKLELVFNAPADGSLVERVEELLNAWRGPVGVTVLEARVDIATSHNRALERCTTRYITFMGDDDLVLEPRIDRILEMFDNTSPTPLVIGSYCRRLSSSLKHPRLLSNKDYGPSSVDEWRRAQERREVFEIVFPSAVYQTDALRRIGGFETRFGSAMDVASMTQLAMHGPVLADTRRTFAHRVHAGSVTSLESRRHAEVLSYTRTCLAALWSGETEPTMDEFLDRTPLGNVRRFIDHRQSFAEAMYRQGGARLAGGSRTSGTAGMALASLISPSTFIKRTRAQVNRSNTGQPIVTVLAKNTNEYRVPFYECVRAMLAEEGIEFRLVSASGLHEDAAKGDRAQLAWAEQRSFREFSVRGSTVLWQPGFDLAANSDLIITEQASKQLFNIPLSYLQRVLHTRHAFWGHGRNFQESIEGSSGEGLKRWLTRRAHWFFAYNELSAQAAIDAGMAAERVTSVMNSTDTLRIREFIERMPADANERIRRENGFGDGPLALFMGGVYEPKQPEFLIAAALAVRKVIPTFELVIIGDGSLRQVVQQAAEDFDWIHWLGARYGDDRLEPASVCSVQMMPGLVGLNVVDAFALGIPTITVDRDWHSPEIDYLEHDVNGIMTPADSTPEEFGTFVADVLSDPDRLAKLRAEAKQWGEKLSIEDMARRFADGVIDALEAPTR